MLNRIFRLMVEGEYWSLFEPKCSAAVANMTLSSYCELYEVVPTTII